MVIQIHSCYYEPNSVPKIQPTTKTGDKQYGNVVQQIQNQTPYKQ